MFFNGFDNDLDWILSSNGQMDVQSYIMTLQGITL